MERSSSVKSLRSEAINLRAIPENIARHAPWVLIPLGLLIVILRTLEYLASTNENSLFYLGNVTLTVFLLIVAGSVTSSLSRSLYERTQAMALLRLRHDLAVRLSSCQDISELTLEMVEQLAPIVPGAGIDFHLYDGKQNWFLPAEASVERKPHEDSASDGRPGLDPYLCRDCLAIRDPALHALESCSQPGYLRTEKGYCVPLVHGTAPVGLLQLGTLDAADLTTNQKELIANVSVVLSSSLYIANEQKAHQEALLAQKTRALQLAVARDLHDTVGQNISYLRIRLQQLSGTGPQDRKKLAVEIQHLCSVADESYDLVRSTLSLLQSGFSADLSTILRQYGELVAERSNFGFTMVCEGHPRSLPPGVVRPLFYVFREALSNVEKHAQARQVSSTLHWGERVLDLILRDDGCGFDARALPVDDHYGLKFMRERAELLKGSFAVVSSPGAGTQIVIHVPIEPGSAEGMRQ